MRDLSFPSQTSAAPAGTGHDTASVPDVGLLLSCGPGPGPDPVLPPGTGPLPRPAADPGAHLDTGLNADLGTGLGVGRPGPPAALNVDPDLGLSAVLPGTGQPIVHPLRPGSVAHDARALVRELLRAAGTAAERIDDAELIIGELGANAEVHAAPPYELRVSQPATGPVRFELADSGPGVARIHAVFEHLRTTPDLEPLLMAETGRGLLLTYLLSGGDCHVHPTTLRHTATPGKAVGFALPGVRLIPPAPGGR